MSQNIMAARRCFSLAKGYQDSSNILYSVLEQIPQDEGSAKENVRQVAGLFVSLSLLRATALEMLLKGLHQFFEQDTSIKRSLADWLSSLPDEAIKQSITDLFSRADNPNDLITTLQLMDQSCQEWRAENTSLTTSGRVSFPVKEADEIIAALEEQYLSLGVFGTNE